MIHYRPTATRWTKNYQKYHMFSNNLWLHHVTPKYIKKTLDRHKRLLCGQWWSPRGRILGLEGKWGHIFKSLALALPSVSLTPSLFVASQRVNKNVISVYFISRVTLNRLLDFHYPKIWGVYFSLKMHHCRKFGEILSHRPTFQDIGAYHTAWARGTKSRLMFPILGSRSRWLDLSTHAVL